MTSIPLRRTSWLLFLSCFVTFAWFHQGGGWNQNGRFALVRAIAEGGTFFIDDYLVYALPPGQPAFRRLEIRAGEFELDGRKYAAGWRNAQGALVPVSDSAGAGAQLIDITAAGATGDVAFHRGHFHPNKAPGTSLLAVPAYFVLLQVERLIGVDPDHWRVLNVNAWLTGAFSVGLISALGAVLLFRMALLLAGGRRVPALLTALAGALGTLLFPYATMLYEHNVIAVALLGSWYLARVAPDAGGSAPRRYWWSGLLAGIGAITNYMAAGAVVMLGAYVLRQGGGQRRGWLWFSLGVLGPFLLICTYNAICFGTPFTTNYRYQNPAFVDGSAALGVLGVPDPGVLAAILVSPFRGLFVTSPVLLLGVAGLWWMWKRPEWRRDAMLCGGILAFFLAFNAGFNGWHGGWAAGPRYLVPALPFAIVPLALAFLRLPRLTTVLAGISAGIMLLVTTVDPQPPVGVGALATVPGRPLWSYNPLLEYEVPLLVRGRAEPLVQEMAAEGARTGSTRLQRLAEVLATVEGPVSVNPVGIYESTLYAWFPPGSEQARWNSFNAGELLWSGSRASMLPLVVLAAALLVPLLREARREDVSDAP